MQCMGVGDSHLLLHMVWVHMSHGSTYMGRDVTCSARVLGTFTCVRTWYGCICHMVISGVDKSRLMGPHAGGTICFNGGPKYDMGDHAVMPSQRLTPPGMVPHCWQWYPISHGWVPHENMVPLMHVVTTRSIRTIHRHMRTHGPILLHTMLYTMLRACRELLCSSWAAAGQHHGAFAHVLPHLITSCAWLLHICYQPKCVLARYISCTYLKEFR